LISTRWKGVRFHRTGAFAVARSPNEGTSADAVFFPVNGEIPSGVGDAPAAAIRRAHSFTVWPNDGKGMFYGLSLPLVFYCAVVERVSWSWRKGPSEASNGDEEKQWNTKGSAFTAFHRQFRDGGYPI
jgi:hypothetical protein